MSASYDPALAPARSAGANQSSAASVLTTWAVVVPVKLLAQAKSRLATMAGSHRERLALAMATDTVTAALAAPRVREVIVVTDDPVAAPVLAEAGAKIVPDEPDAGLNPALRHGAGLADADTGEVAVAALSADLPALRPYELARALDAAKHHDIAFVPDAAGVGTTLYAAALARHFAPEFGSCSRDRHAAVGAHEITVNAIDSVRRDVDTPDDLHAAAELGLGRNTASLIDLLPDASTY